MVTKHVGTKQTSEEHGSWHRD